MITLLQLFNYGDNYYESSGIVWKFIANFIGIGFSFLIAYKILKIQLKYDKEKERIKLEETYNSHYNLIKELINDTISTCEAHLKNIKKFIEDSKKDPFGRNSLNFYLFPELRRFQKLENEMTFNSFMYKLKSYPDKNTIYRKIYNSIYFIEKSNELIQICHSDLTHKSEFLVQKFKDINTEISSLTHVYIGKLNLMNPIEQEIFNEVMIQQKIYLELLQETQNITDVEEKYIQPLIRLFALNIKDIPDCSIILIKAREASTIIGDLQFESKKKVEFIEEEMERLSKALVKLKDTMNRIL